MKKILFMMTFALLLPFMSSAQKTVELQKSISFDMGGENGTNGANVAYNPKYRLYYAAFAGNAEFPMGVFDQTGKRVSSEDLTTGFDLRGLWFDPKTGGLAGQGYGEGGWVAYQLNDEGMPTSAEVKFEGQNQPNGQAVGAFDANRGLVYFLSGNKIVAYNQKDAQENPEETVNIAFLMQGEDTPEGETPVAYNSTTVTFTGWKGREFGILNHDSRQVELYNRKTGKCTEILKLPEDCVVNEMFNFAYANNHFWFFDTQLRIWHGYELLRP